MKTMRLSLFAAATFVAAICCTQMATFAADAETTMLDAAYQLRKLPVLRDGTVTQLFSSYDRTGGNNDGFSGQFSKLRLEDGNSVLAEMEGAGCIQRIWFTHSDDNFGLLARKHEHIRVYIDGNTDPVLDIPLEEVFTGNHPAFPKPLVGEGLGGFYCYVPIPYSNGCKVVVDGDNVRFYQITYQTFPAGTEVVSFTATPTPNQAASLARGVKAWSECGNLDTLDVHDADTFRTQVNLKPGQVKTIELRRGRNIVRAIRFLGTDEQLANAGDSFITINWDGAEKSAVAAPLNYFFLAASQAIPLKTLLVGRNENGWYNYMPMPYQSSATLTLHALQIDAGLSGTLEVVTEPMPNDYPPHGYFHTKFSTVCPPSPHEWVPFLKHNGRGHFIGVYMDTDGVHPQKIPNWMEGDDRWFTDGVFRGQGTGSEDYFNCGWYALDGRLNNPGGFPVHGFPVYRFDGERSWCAAYRWHVTDPVSFSESIVAEIEHGEVNTYIANYRTIAFYYDVEP
ncbi:MAG: DUF2961 domain-containing protein [Thermoguttaceae bacterium]